MALSQADLITTEAIQAALKLKQEFEALHKKPACYVINPNLKLFGIPVMIDPTLPPGTIAIRESAL